MRKNENNEIFIGLKIKLKDLIEKIDESNFEQTKTILQNSFLQKKHENKIFNEIIIHCSSNLNNYEDFKTCFISLFTELIPFYSSKTILYPIQSLDLYHNRLNNTNSKDISFDFDFLKNNIPWISSEINIILKEIN